MSRHIKTVLRLAIPSRTFSSLDGTLQHRFLEHLQKNHQISPKIQFLSSQLAVHPIKPEDKTQLDMECTNLIRNNKNITENLLDALVRSSPGQVTSLKVFPEAVKILFRKFESNPTEKLFVKLCFYLGLFKKKSPGPILLENLVEEHFPGNLDSLDFAIVCTACYKASVKVKNAKFQEKLVKEFVNCRQVDPYIFIVFAKSLRQNRINSPAVLEKLRQFQVEGQLKLLDYQALIHVFPLMADNHIKDEGLTEFLVKQCMETMTGEVRAKDAQKLLYSCAQLNFPLSQDRLETLEKFVLSRTEHEEFRRKFDNFVDAALSMWMLNYKSRGLIEKLLKDTRIFKSGEVSRVKLDSRKKLLLTCVEIEEPSWLKETGIKFSSFDEERAAPKYLMRPSLVAELKKFDGKSSKIVQQVANLNFAGILSEDESGGRVHIEVLDNTTSLSDKISPNGIFALKVRLLESQGCRVKIVRGFEG